MSDYLSINAYFDLLSPERRRMAMSYLRFLAEEERPLHLMDNPIHITVSDLKAKCARKGITVYPGNLVTRKDAAYLLGRSVGTIANWASYGNLKTYPMQNLRAMHSLNDIAVIISRR